VDGEAVLGVDKDIKARFLLPLMEMQAAKGFVNTSLAVDNTRGIKDAEEQEKMRVASDLNDQAMAVFKTLIRQGVTEKEVADQMLKIYQDLGADGFSFEPLVAFGPNAADPHHGPDNTVLKEGDVILFDVGCIKDGYCSDMTRSFYYRTITDTHREVYETVRAANEAAIAKIKPGVPLCELDLTARNLITHKGYGPQFNHRLGHFIGLSCHEFGDVSSVNTRLAEPGMIFSIEPGIYLTGDTGVRIEDLVLVTETGCEVLNHYPKTLEIIE
jgi:Xaa-Pro dipeptidase